MLAWMTGYAARNAEAKKYPETAAEMFGLGDARTRGVARTGAEMRAAMASMGSG